MNVQPDIGFRLKTLLTRPRVVIALIASVPLSALAIDAFPYWLMNRIFGYSWEPWLMLSVMIAVVATAAFLEARSEKFQQILHTRWRRAQVNLARAQLRAKEKSVLQVRGRPTFQRDRLRRMQAAQKEFFDELIRAETADTPVQQELIDQAMRAFSRYYELLQKEQRVAGLLESTNRTEIERDIARLERQADSTSSEARTQYLRAAEFRKQELRSLERAEQLSSLLQAHMDALESAMATMRTRIINSAVWDASGIGNAYTDLTQELLALEKAFTEVAALEKEPLFDYEKFE